MSCSFDKKNNCKVFFVGDGVMRVGLRIFGRGQRALGANAKNQFFDSSF